ncbi:MAG: nucleotidyltransferase family protein [Paludibacteraceae bacterium]|nr:nucleotidyltransferase family protein [Paludibacteraceae bacterium]
MQAMIFCAGLGTRLKPLTDTMPKALVPMAGKPLLQWQVEKLRDAGITDIVINVHHFPDQIIDAVRANNGWGCDIAISDERDALLDTGGGLKKAQSQITNHNSQMASEPLLACNVDILSNIDLRALIAEYERISALPSARNGGGLLVVSDRPTQRYLCFDDNQRLTGWTNIATGEVRPENVKSQISNLKLLAFSGMQILSPDILSLLSHMPQDKFSLIDFYMSLCEKSITNLKAYIPDAFKMMDVGKIDQIAEAERFAESL